MFDYFSRQQIHFDLRRVSWSVGSLLKHISVKALEDNNLLENCWISQTTINYFP